MKPKLSDSDRTLEFFNGALRTRILDEPDCAFAFEAQFRFDDPLAAELSAPSPSHFHPYQDEYIQVVHGQIVVQLEGQEQIRSAEDGELCIKAWTNHSWWPLQPTSSSVGGKPSSDTRVLLWGQNTTSALDLQADILFFENLYQYRDDTVKNKIEMNIFQLLCMFDAGGSYLSPPRWIPFGQHISRFAGIALGRWLGSSMGYQPYYRKWSSDWDLACSRMHKCVFQRRFVEPSDAR
ncbi:hypothetical protein F5Y15DRAFT_397766 [Xylariaceae sp. FL0016]|nr:hypothetical protein F5Y15DRAFT_397766 [Xylariaceae sp. FL0016]